MFIQDKNGGKYFILIHEYDLEHVERKRERDNQRQVLDVGCVNLVCMYIRICLPCVNVNVG